MGISIAADLSNSPVSASTTGLLTVNSFLLHYLLFQQEYCKYLLNKTGYHASKKRYPS